MDSSQSQLLYLCLAYKITMFWLWLCWFIEALIKPFFFLSIGHLVFLEYAWTWYRISKSISHARQKSRFFPLFFWEEETLHSCFVTWQIWWKLIWSFDHFIGIFSFGFGRMDQEIRLQCLTLCDQFQAAEII